MEDEGCIATGQQLKSNLKLNKESCQLLQCIDGKSNLKDISERYQEKFNLKLSEKIIWEIISKKLAPFGLFENIQPTNKQFRRKYLFLRVNFLSKNQLNFFAKGLLFVFKLPHTGYIALVLYLISLLYLIFHFQLIWETATRLSGNQTLFIVCILIISSFMHEAGHAAASLKYHIKARAMGFGFYLLLPVLYCDVSDSWKLSTNKRMMVNVGGIIIENWIAFLLVLFHLIMNKECMLLGAALLCVKIMFHINPFIRNDGYWMLSDMLGVHNMKEKSNQLLFAFLRGILSRKHLPAAMHKGMILYALISNVIIWLIIALILLYDTNHIIQFPVNLLYIMKNAIQGDPFQFDFIKTEAYLIPMLFYILFFRNIINLLVSILKVRRNYSDNHF